MKKTQRLNKETVENKLKEHEVKNLDLISIRELVHIVNELEEECGTKFIRMEMGVPGLPPHPIGVEAEIKAIREGLVSKYPMIDGIKELKVESSRFLKLFLNAEIPPEYCIPTVGSMQGSFAAFLTLCRKDPKQDKVLFIAPGFPVQRGQLNVLGIESKWFDIFNYRGEKLKNKLEEMLSPGDTAAIVYSTPNNPTWICLSEHELEIIAEVTRKYNVTVIEDLAYFGMDFRKDYSKPGQPPYPPSITSYSDDYILLLSSSKIFSYAGQRIAFMAVSPELFRRKFTNLKNYFLSDIFGKALIYSALYTLSAGTSHSAQYAFAALLKAVNDGELNFLEPLKEYARRAATAKKLFKDNGFHILYDKDEDSEVGNGFYFTISYPSLNSAELMKGLLSVGISAVSLTITGSSLQKGLRACVSQIHQEDMPELESRLKKFREKYK